MPARTKQFLMELCLGGWLPFIAIFIEIFIYLQQVYQIESDLKSKANAYNQLKVTLQSMERKAT